MASQRRQRRRQFNDCIIPTFVNKRGKASTDWTWLNKSILFLIVCSTPWLLLRDKSISFGAAVSVTNGLIGLSVELEPVELDVAWKHRERKRRKLNLVQYSFSDREILGAKKSIGHRKNAYSDAGRLPQWFLRGVGYLYLQHGIVLSAVFLEGPQAKPGPNVVAIYNVGRGSIKDCALLTIWVRVIGPEIFAGSAEPMSDVDTDLCHWEFWFDLMLPGDYEVDVKALLWRGSAPDNPKNITVIRNNQVPLEHYPYHAGFPGFNFEHANERCSEVCTRVPGCIYWSTPALHYLHHEGCELYFNTSEQTIPFQYDFPEVNIPPTEQSYELSTIGHGPPHGNITSYFIGCGWSFWLNTISPCLSGSSDDRIYMAENMFTLPAIEQQRESKSLSLCSQKDHENMDHGRWVEEEYPLVSLCPEEYEVWDAQDSILKKYKMLKHIPQHPHCWFRENISSLGEHCYDGGCAAHHKEAWRSSLQTEERWFGMWHRYDCNYLELMDEELQMCIDKRHIVSIEVVGGDMASFLRDYLAQRMKGIKLFDAPLRGTPKTVAVKLDTLNAMSLVSVSQDEWKRQLASDRYPRPKSGEEYYWVEAMYFTSERKPHRNAVRALEFNRDAHEILGSKHYKRISAYNLSAAFSFDSSTELDGTHIIGPPMRMIITKLFHYMCVDYESR